MNEQLVAELTARYENLDEGELFDLMDKVDTLTEEAKAAVEVVIARRGPAFHHAKEVAARESAARAESEVARAKRQQVRDGSFLKKVLVVAAVIIIIDSVLASGWTFGALALSLNLLLILALVVWLLSGALKSRGAKSVQKS